MQNMPALHHENHNLLCRKASCKNRFHKGDRDYVTAE